MKVKISQDIKKRTVKLHKSSSSLGTMTIVTFGGKMGMLVNLVNFSKLMAIWGSQTSNISQEIKAPVQIGLSNGPWLEAYSQSDYKVNVLARPPPSPQSMWWHALWWHATIRHDLNTLKKLQVNLRKCVPVRPTYLTILHQFCEKKWARISVNYCERLVEGTPKGLTRVIKLPNTGEMYVHLWLWRN